MNGNSIATAAAALIVISAIAPTAASADRADPFAGPPTRCVGSIESSDTGGSPPEIAQRKALMAQYYVDHALELHQRAAR